MRLNLELICEETYHVQFGDKHSKPNLNNKSILKLTQASLVSKTILMLAHTPL